MEDLCFDPILSWFSARYQMALCNSSTSRICQLAVCCLLSFLPIGMVLPLATFLKIGSYLALKLSPIGLPRCPSFSAFRVPPSDPNGGLVPDSGEGRSFVINQIGGFVFQRTCAFSLQPSVWDATS